MPIYEYLCRECGARFELLIRGTSAMPACPACDGKNLEKLLSLPAVKSEATHALAMKAAGRRDARQASERARTQREYEANHDNE
jgi:putative FmdB family regulatory protein